MKEEWRVTIRGVRGSAPRPVPGYTEYGGNTVCTALEYQGHIVVLDAGTGLTGLGKSLAVREDITQVDILLSHFHIDHVLGLFSFQPLFNPEIEVHFYGGAGLARYLEMLVGPPFWPLEIRDLPARVRFHELCPGESFALDGLSVSTMAGNHPGGSILYRLEGAGKCLTYTLDCEVNDQMFSALTGFARGSDLLIWDAAFTRSDLRLGWGHSTWEHGLELGHAAMAGQVLMSHYSQDYTDEFLRCQEKLAGADRICRFAKEGMVVVL